MQLVPFLFEAELGSFLRGEVGFRGVHCVPGVTRRTPRRRVAPEVGGDPPQGAAKWQTKKLVSSTKLNLMKEISFHEGT
jgi:hypothetical protein